MFFDWSLTLLPMSILHLLSEKALDAILNTFLVLSLANLNQLALQELRKTSLNVRILLRKLRIISLSVEALCGLF